MLRRQAAASAPDPTHSQSAPVHCFRPATGSRNFSAPPTRATHVEVRDHVGPHESTRRASYMSYRGLQQQRQLKTNLIEPDVRAARIRLSDKSSRLHPRHVVPKPAQAYEPEVPVEEREWIGPAPASPGFVLDAQRSPGTLLRRCLPRSSSPIRATCRSTCPPASARGRSRPFA
jgi:hypothetical protein